jgi:hypothetical protein
LRFVTRDIGRDDRVIVQTKRRTRGVDAFLDVLEECRSSIRADSEICDLTWCGSTRRRAQRWQRVLEDLPILDDHDKHDNVSLWIREHVNVSRRITIDEPQRGVARRSTILKLSA